MPGRDGIYCGSQLPSQLASPFTAATKRARANGNEYDNSYKQIWLMPIMNITTLIPLITASADQAVS